MCRGALPLASMRFRGLDRIGLFDLAIREISVPLRQAIGETCCPDRQALDGRSVRMPNYRWLALRLAGNRRPTPGVNEGKASRAVSSPTVVRQEKRAWPYLVTGRRGSPQYSQAF